IHPAHWPPRHIILLARVLDKLIAATLAAASVAFFFLLLDRLTTRRNAVLLTAVYAFATSTWTISSQALWQHSGGELLLVLTLFTFARWIENHDRPKFLALAGLCAGLAFTIRQPSSLLY